MGRMPIRALAGLTLLAGAVIVARAPAADVPPQQRYDQARHAMQAGRSAEAAAAFRALADDDGAPLALRAQALFATGLMQENARRYEEATALYQEVERRFAGTEAAGRARDANAALTQGGAARGIALRHRQDDAWDAWTAAQDHLERDGLRAARPDLEAAATLLDALLGDLGDLPKARDVAMALGDVHMMLRRFHAAADDFERAAGLARARQAAGASSRPEADSLVMEAVDRRDEALRCERRQRLTRVAESLLATVVLGLLLVRPWHATDAQLLRLGGGLALTTLVLAVLAMGGAYVLRNFTEEQSPVSETAAGLLVALPGVTAVVVALGFTAGLQRTRAWRPARAAGVAGVAAAVAALAVATCLIDAFALFPVLDSLL